MAETVSLCRDCHRAIHDFIPDEKRLGRSFYTLELLSQEPQMARHIEWVRKQR